jgi:hypothetical protein
VKLLNLTFWRNVNFAFLIVNLFLIFLGFTLNVLSVIPWYVVAVPNLIAIVFFLAAIINDGINGSKEHEAT